MPCEMRISIAMATYNGEKYLQSQLDSFQAQTRLPDELLVSDDCSSDGTVAILKGFSKVASFPVTISENNERLGYAENFNKALEMTSGDLVFLSDQDDVWFSEKIETMLGVARSEQGMLAFMNDAALTDEVLREVGLTKVDQIRSAGLSESSFVMGSCAAIRRELLDLCLPIPAGYKAHDRWIVSFADALEKRIVIDAVLQYYRRHEKNESEFIGNRTQPLRPLDVWFHYIRQLANGKDDEAQRITRAELLLDGIRCAVARSGAEHHQNLRKFEWRIAQELHYRKKRAEVRRRARLFRIGPVGGMLCRGEYWRCGDIRHAARDIFFK